jgi:hypothetical protein
MHTRTYEARLYKQFFDVGCYADTLIIMYKCDHMFRCSISKYLDKYSFFSCEVMFVHIK